jgi:hypothetical protein
MKKTSKNTSEVNEMRPEYDFSDSVPNKYAKRLKEQEHLIALSPDVYEVFNSSEQVNEILRSIIKAYPKKKNEATV